MSPREAELFFLAGGSGEAEEGRVRLVGAFDPDEWLDVEDDFDPKDKAPVVTETGTFHFQVRPDVWVDTWAHLRQAMASNVIAHRVHVVAPRMFPQSQPYSLLHEHPAQVHVYEPIEQPDADVAPLFEELADRWRREVEFESSLTRMVMHPAYQRIIGIGPSVVPLLLRDLEREPEYWFWALTAITGEDPAEGAEDLDEASERWLAWGRERGLIA